MNVDPIRQAVQEAVRVELDAYTQDDEKHIRKIVQGTVDKALEGLATRVEVHGLRDMLVGLFQSSAAAFSGAKLHKKPSVQCVLREHGHQNDAANGATKPKLAVRVPVKAPLRKPPTPGTGTAELLTRIRDLVKIGTPVELKLADIAKSIKTSRYPLALALTRAAGAKLNNGKQGDHLVPAGLKVEKVASPTSKPNGRTTLTWRLTRTA